MFKNNCFACAKKLEKEFHYCPYCGASQKDGREKEDYGLLGRDDTMNLLANDFQLPTGMEKIMNTLIKQLEKQMSNIEPQHLQGIPKGFHIKITSGKPTLNQQQPEPRKKEAIMISQEELIRRSKLPKVDAESKIKRLADKIIYEINVPGIKDKQDVAITPLANGFEIKAYSKDTCYTKTIPLKAEGLHYKVKEDKVYIELRE